MTKAPKILARPRAKEIKKKASPKPRIQRIVKSKVPTEALVKQPKVPVTARLILETLVTTDTKMKEKALELVSRDILSEPVIPMNTAIRVAMQASLELGRPYDANMLAATFSVTRSLVMQSLRKYYVGYTEQSEFTERLFVPTYLWVYGVTAEAAEGRVNHAIDISGAGEPGSRSVFAIARDFVILFVSEILHSGTSGLSSISSMMASIKTSEGVPPCFLDMTNSFLYRARMTGRNVIKAKPELGNMISDLF